MDKLDLSPDQSGYAFQDDSGVESFALEGGLSVSYLDSFEPSSIVDVTWICDPSEYEELTDFYLNTVKRGSLPFLMDLDLAETDLAEYRVHFVPDTFSLKTLEGETYTVTAQLEAYRNDTGDIDILIVCLYPSDPSTLFDALSHLVNVTMPESIG